MGKVFWYIEWIQDKDMGAGEQIIQDVQINISNMRQLKLSLQDVHSKW